MHGMKAQSAIEFLSTYGWAILIIAAAATMIYFFLTTLLGTTPSQCSFGTQAPCQDIAVSTNSANSLFQVLLVNSQIYAVKNPILAANIVSIGGMHGTCGPSFVASGGSIFCNITGPAIPSGIGIHGTLVFNQSVCTSIGQASCPSSVMESFNGSFTTTVGKTPKITCSITLTPGSSSQASNGQTDPLVAVVSISGVPIGGATVNFTSSNALAPIAPQYALSATNGTAVSYISSTTAGLGAVTIAGNFLKGCTSNTIVTFS